MNIFGLYFGIIDWIIVGIMVLFLIVGLAKGFVKQIMSFAKGLLAIIIDIFLVNPVASLLSKTKLFDIFNGKVNPFIIEKFPEAASIDTSMITTQEQLDQAFTEAGLSKIVSKIAGAILKVETIGESPTLADAVSYAVVLLILKIIAFIVLFIVILITLKILVKVLESIVDKSMLAKVFDKILGFGLGAIKGALLVCVTFLLIGLIARFVDQVGEFFSAKLFLEDDSIMTIGKYIYQTNPLSTFFKMIFG